MNPARQDRREFIRMKMAKGSHEHCHAAVGERTSCRAGIFVPLDAEGVGVESHRLNELMIGQSKDFQPSMPHRLAA